VVTPHRVHLVPQALPQQALQVKVLPVVWPHKVAPAVVKVMVVQVVVVQVQWVEMPQPAHLTAVVFSTLVVVVVLAQPIPLQAAPQANSAVAPII
jgi:hypothetical protein